jgi:hypothetical protein
MELRLAEFLARALNFNSDNDHWQNSNKSDVAIYMVIEMH